MNTDDYLAKLDEKLRDMEGIIASTVVHREIDANLGIGFIKGLITFSGGFRLEFSEQLPIQRCKYRLHYMDAEDRLVIRWDSAPHHKELGTFPFHRHTTKGVEACEAMTLLEALTEIALLLCKSGGI